MAKKTLSKTTSSALEGASPEQVEWLTNSMLTVVVVGASGDLAKKKTYPSLLNLYVDDLLPDDTVVWGYARSKLSDDELRERLRPYLLKSGEHPEAIVDEFLESCRYQGGSSYGDEEAFASIQKAMEEKEASLTGLKGYNRLFYFAVPPNVFAETGLAIKKTCMQDDDKGWTRLIVEKPFGRDLASFEVRLPCCKVAHD
jgi:glucose-6-phosphate 1-dehydrogenase